MITVRCSCGELFHADEQHAGRRLRCRCGDLVEIRAPEPPPPAARPAPSRARWRKSGSGTRPAWSSAGPRLVRLLEIISLSYLGTTLAACIALWGLSDQWWPATLFLFVGRWVLLLPLVVLLPAALIWRSRLILPLLAAAAVVVFPVMGVRPGSLLPARGLADAPRFRLVTFNTGGRPHVAGSLDRLLRDWSPDFVAFQECAGELVDAVVSRPGWHGHAERGLCIISRHPIAAVAVMDRGALARIRETTAIGGAGEVVRYSLRTPHGPVDVVNLHLETPRKGFEALAARDLDDMRGNTTLRGIESSLARQFAAGATAPLIVAGDFNMPVESRIYQRSWADLRNAYSRAGRGLGSTRYNGWIRVRIDHVLTGPEWWAERAVVGPDEGSDHRPLIADLRLRR